MHLVEGGSTEAEDMPFSRENEQWIRDTIDQAIRRAINPLSRTKRLLQGLKDWGLTALIWTVPLALMAGCIVLGIRVVSDIKEETTFRTNTTRDIREIKESLLSFRARTAALNPTDPQNQADAKKVLSTAQAQAIPLSLPVVQQAGLAFAHAASADAKAWNVALDFISYRSSLNKSGHPDNSTEPIPQGAGATHYTYVFVPGRPHGEVKWGRPFVPADQAAHWDNIGVNLNENVKLQPSWLYVEGGATSLDGEYIRHVVFKNVEIHYSGQPVILEDVTFVDCVFVLDNDVRGRQLAEQVLAASSVTFQAVG